MKKGLITFLGITAISLASFLPSAKATTTDLGFYKQSSYSPTGIKIYNYENALMESFQLNPGSYTFKSKIRNFGDETASSPVNGYITGPENFQWQNLDITNLVSGNSLLRQHTETLTNLGNYEIKFELTNQDSDLNNNTTIRNFEIIPEPLTLSFLGLGLIPFLKRKK